MADTEPTIESPPAASGQTPAKAQGKARLPETNAKKSVQEGRRISKLRTTGLVRGVGEDKSFFIKGDIDSLNVDYPFSSKNYVEEQQTVKLLRGMYFNWIVGVLVGVLTGVLFVFLIMACEGIVATRIYIFNEYFVMSSWKWFALAWCGVCLVACILSSILVIWIEPGAEGSGVPEIGCYLNGVDVPRFDRWTVIPIRILSTLLMVIGGMPGGLEEPLLPIGCIIGVLLSKIRIPSKPFAFLNSFHNDQFKRKAVTMGLGASAAAAFGTPVGGAIFAIEQLSHWQTKMPLITIVSAFCSAFSSNYIYNYFRSTNLKRSETFSFFAPFGPEKVMYDLQELPVFMLMALIGGLSGALWNAIHVQLCRLRIRYIQRNRFKLLEVVVIALVITLSVALTFLPLSDHCFYKSVYFKEFFLFDYLDKLKGVCQDKHMPTASMYLLFQPKALYRSLFVLPEGMMENFPLIAGIVLFFVWSCAHLGTAMPSGIIIPNLIIGAMWGRLFKSYVVDNLIEEETPAAMAKYSFLAAAAQAGGVTRLSIGLGVMMIEAAGSINFCIPIFLILFCSAYISGIFTPSIYDIRSYCQGYPALSPHPPPLSLELTARDVLARRIVAVPQTMTVDTVKNVLKNYQHTAFPVLDINDILDKESGVPQSPRIKGIILRKQLLALLKPHKESSILSLRYERADPLTTLPGNAEINLEKSLNPSPFYVVESMPLFQVHDAFTNLRLHHLLVVSDRFQIVGLITRKDIAMIHLQSQFFVKSVIMRNIVYFKRA